MFHYSIFWLCVCVYVRFFLPCQNILLPVFFVLDNVITIY